MATPGLYDVVIAYRIYPGVSKHPFVYPQDKLKLTEVGIRTLRQSLGKLSAKFTFILDNCPADYEAMIRNHLQASDIEIFNLPGIGNLPTFGKQIDILLAQTQSEIVMFAEDDYVYRKGEMEKAVNLLRNNPSIDFVTPFDHLDSYTLSIHTRNRYEILISDGLHWRSSASSCLTFLTRKNILQKNEKIFRSYTKGNWDSSLWFSLTKYNLVGILPSLIFRWDIYFLKTIALSWFYGWSQILFGKKYKLWQPIPSVATHMESTTLAPGVDWEKVVAESTQSQ